MKLNSQVVAALLAMAVPGLAGGMTQSNLENAWSNAAKAVLVSHPAPPAQATPPGSAATADELQTVLARMNQTAANFKSFHADFDWETFDKLINETEIQRGQAYLRRQRSDKGSDLEALFNFNTASGKGNGTLAKQALYKDRTILLYEPKINRITEHEVGKNKSDVDAFMSLGFGGRGDDLATSFKVTWLGWETIDGVKTAKLEVTGKTPSLRKCSAGRCCGSIRSGTSQSSNSSSRHRATIASPAITTSSSTKGCPTVYFV